MYISQNSMKWNIMQFIGEGTWWTTQELFNALTEPAKRPRGLSDREYAEINNKMPLYRIFSYASFQTTMCKLHTSGYILAEKDQTCPYKTYRYRRAPGIFLEPRRPKNEEAVFNQLKLAVREYDTRHG